MRADRTHLMRPALIVLAILAGRPGEARAAAAPAAPTQAQATMVGAGGAGGASAAGGGAMAPVPDLFTGSLGYSVPIELPPGRNGMTPGVELSYQSRNGTGWLGVGWELAIGAVERNLKNGPNYGAEDYVLRVAGASQELVVIPGGEFRAKIESDFKRARKLTATDGRPYWEVTDRKGTRFLYGQTSASRQDNPADASQIFGWRLDRIEDTHGNFATFTYFKDSGEIYPQSIAYNGNTIRFWLGAASPADATTSYATKFAVATAYLLKTIEVQAQGQLQRAYKVTYVASSTSSRSLLSSIQGFGSDASVDQVTGDVVEGANPPPPAQTLLAQTFGWQQPPGTGGGSTSTAGYTPPAYLSWRDGTLYGGFGTGTLVADLDGDGRPDMIQGWSNYGTPARDAWINTGSGWGEDLRFAPPADFVGRNDTAPANWDAGLRIVDLDGDGLPDLIQGWSDQAAQCSLGVACFTENHFAAWHNNGGTNPDGTRCTTTACAWDPVPSYAPPVQFTTRDLTTASGWDEGVRLVDVNGDGRPDLVQGHYAWGSSVREAWINNGTGWTYCPAYAPPTDFSGRDSGTSMPGWDAGVRLTDLDGDGRVDIVQGWGNYTDPPGNYPPVLGAWMNNGSPIDCATSAKYSAWTSTPGFNPPQVFTRREGGTDSSTGVSEATGWDNGLRLADLNGDGKPDLVWSTLTWGVRYTGAWLNTGSGWAPAPEYAAVPADFVGKDAGATMTGWDSGLRVVDLNGDGKADLVQGWYNYGLPELQNAWINTGHGWTPNNAYAPTEAFTGRDGSAPGGWDAGLLIEDVDGDGRPDLLDGWYNFGQDHRGTRRLLGPFPDLLSTIENGIGGRITVSYSSTAAFGGTRLPSPVQVVRTVTIDDGNGVSATTSYSYEGGAYSGADREFRGFNHVYVVSPMGPSGEQTLTETWFHQGNDTGPWANNSGNPVGYMKGKPYAVRVSNGNGNGFASYADVITTYTTGSTAPPYFNPPSRVDTTACDVVAGTVTCGMATRTDYFYEDAFGNVTREDRHGDVGTTADDVTVIRTFSANTTAWILGLPSSEKIYKGVGAVEPVDPIVHPQLSGAAYYFDGTTDNVDCSPTGYSATPTKGDLTLASRWLQGGTDPQAWMGYDVYGNVVCTSDPDRRMSKIGYDPTGTFATTFTNTLNQVSRKDYYGGAPTDIGRYGQLRSVTDPNNAATIYEYDTFGRKTKETLPGGTSSISTFYYLGGVGTNRTETTTSLGAWSVNYFDGTGRPYWSQSKGSSGGRVFTTVRKYNVTGTVKQTSLPYEGLAGVLPPDSALRWTTYSFDGVGRVLTATNPDGTRQQACFKDSEGSAVAIDANGHQRREVKDVRGNRVLVQEYQGMHVTCTADAGTPYATTTYKYDAFNRLTSVKNAAETQPSTIIVYDTLGRRKSATDPDLGAWSYDYTAGGDLWWQQDAKGKTIAFTYDDLHRVKTKSYPTGTGVVYTYDDPLVPNSIGRLTQMTDASGTTAFLEYDPRGRVTKKAQTIDGTWYTVLTSYEPLDPAGRTTSITYPDGGPSAPAGIVTYNYDADGALATVGNAAGATYATMAGYNALGQVRTVTFGHDPGELPVVTTFAYYDATSNRLQSITTGKSGALPLLALTYSYDSVGNITQIADGVDTTRTQNFGYDELNRLISAQSPAYAITPGTVIYGYDPVKIHAVNSTSDGKTYGYDPNGNMQSDGTRTFTWNYDNRPTSITAGAATTTFTYDGTGQRVKKVGAAGTTLYVGKLYECTNGACARNIYAGSQLLASVATATGTVKYYHLDHLGSPRLTTDTSGTPVEAFFYKPFGEAAPATSGRRFTGQILDAETGLYFYNARYYDPQLGRFISPDNFANPHEPQVLNRYSYVLNNPVAYVDPTGNWTLLAVAGAVGASGCVASVWCAVAVTATIVVGWEMDGKMRGYQTPMDRIDPRKLGHWTHTNADAFGGQLKSGWDRAGGVGRNTAGPFQVGWEWLSGTGPRNQVFHGGDPFTEQLRQHSHIEDTRRLIASDVANSRYVGANGYRLDGWQGVPKYFGDYSTLLTFGGTGNPAVTYLGGYGLSYNVTSVDAGAGTAEVDFHVWNVSSLESLAHVPVIGYTDWWKRNVGAFIRQWRDGPMSPTRQDFYWSETVRWP